MIKRNLVKILISLLVIFAFDRLVGAYLSRLYERNECEHASGDLNAFLKSKEPFDTLIIGSSRVNTMINPRLLGKKIRNITKPAKHFYYSVAVTDLLSQHDRMPKKMLIVNIELEDLFAETEERLIEDVCYLKYYYGKNDFITAMINQRGFFERLKFFFSCYRFNGENIKLVTNPFQNICITSENGFIPLQKGIGDEERLQKGLSEMNQLYFTKMNKEFIVRLTHLLSICQKANVKLVLIHGPNYCKMNYMHIGSKFLTKYCKKNSIPYIDFTTKYVKKFGSKSLWFDHLHLNAEAATQYTLLLKKELRSLKKPAAEYRGIVN